MRVLYVGELWEGGTCLERMKILREAGWTIFPLDTTPYLKAGGRWLAALQHRLLWGPNVTRFNEGVLNQARSLGKLDVVWVDKGRWLWGDVLDEVKRATGAIAVHYTPDPAFTVHGSRHFNACLPLYDLCITTKRYELETYTRHKARVLFTLQGIDDRFIREPACSRIDARPIDLMFVGHREPHYERLLDAARNAARSSGASLRIFGPRWPDLRKSADWRELVDGPVWGGHYARTLAGARIGLGFLCKMWPDGFTTRTFEIPAAGAMLLAERTPEHQELFEEDAEAVFFGSEDEFHDKIAYYCKNESERHRIALAGRTRAIAQYHWRHVLQPAISLVREVVNQRKTL